MIDLSHPVTSGRVVYPGDPQVRIAPALTVEHDGAAVAQLHMGSHTGTHIDAPSHTVAGGRTIDEVSLDELTGEALVLDVSDRVSDDRAIDSALLGLDRLDAVPRIVLIRTGWDRHFGGERYLRHPYLTGEAAKRLRSLGMRVLGVDALNPDRTPPQGEETEFAVHEVVLGSDGSIVENLRGLDRLGETAQVGFFPMLLAGVDGAPVRAVAWER